ncbi:taurine catabolism dioxygenase [Cordyceps militaris]|uniref:Taurine catabolism dioxygenase n=1 Tax=Cordyceps militaris TaxID=73501 RepID=A0A2H4SGC9_CORMI|nr:taurine catabolism dioxygenase [Cordyceps militaris]
MPGPIPLRMQQVHLGRGPLGHLAVNPSQDTPETVYASEHEKHESILLERCPADIWPGGTSYTYGCPRPILMYKRHHNQLVLFHESIIIAIVDIVKRWFTDGDARFPERMPLLKDEEELLQGDSDKYQWLDTQVAEGNLAPYSTETLGSWRPDFLVEDDNGDENFRLTEINARFCFNGFMHGSYGQTALDSMGMEKSGLVGAADGAEFVNGLFRLFRNDRPLHLLKGEEKGIDIGMFIHAVQLRLGVTPRLITPDDLRLIPDPEDPRCTMLCCLVKSSAKSSSTLKTPSGEVVEKIDQVGLELQQRELAALDRDMMRHISLRCFNDVRTILLVHDKRMLGIIQQELPSLVRRGVLSVEQAQALAKGIADTALPGSRYMQELLHQSQADPGVKDGYLLKPVRGGKGAGIVFGEDLDADEWLAALRDLQSPRLDPAGASLVAQRRVVQHDYELVLKRCGKVFSQPLVGTYHTVHGAYLGIGTWRSSGGRICAVSSGGAWICSVMSPD